MSRAKRPILKEKPHPARLLGDAIHLLTDHGNKATGGVREPQHIVGNAEQERIGEHAVEERRDQLVLPPEVKEDEPMAEFRPGRNGSQGECVNPVSRGHGVRGCQDLLAASFLRCFLAWNGKFSCRFVAIVY